MNWAGAQRQSYIQTCLDAWGWFNRSDLVTKFSISVPQASIDIAKFLKNNPGVMAYNASTKRYERVEA